MGSLNYKDGPMSAIREADDRMVMKGMMGLKRVKRRREMRILIFQKTQHSRQLRAVRIVNPTLPRPQQPGELISLSQ